MSNAGFFYIVMPSSTKNYNMAIGITKSRQIWYISEEVCSESTVAQLTNIWHNPTQVGHLIAIQLLCIFYFIQVVKLYNWSRNNEFPHNYNSALTNKVHNCACLRGYEPYRCFYIIVFISRSFVVVFAANATKNLKICHQIIFIRDNREWKEFTIIEHLISEVQTNLELLKQLLITFWNDTIFSFSFETEPSHTVLKLPNNWLNLFLCKSKN